jgi:hypothetical protein
MKCMTHELFNSLWQRSVHFPIEKMIQITYQS